jgi:hypothetical protein
MLWEKKPLLQRLIDSCLIEAELQRRDVQVSAEDVQAACDEMRRRRGLLSAADLHAWLADSGTTLQALDEMAAGRARALKLRDLVADDRVSDYFERHRDAFDTIVTAVLWDAIATHGGGAVGGDRRGSVRFSGRRARRLHA